MRIPADRLFTLMFLLLASPSAADTIPPNLVATIPPDGATGVAVDGVIRAEFDEAMDPTTINTGSFLLENDELGAFSTGLVILADGDTVATFVPDLPLDPDTTYVATLTSSITDVSGNALAPYTWSFATVPEPTTALLLATGLAGLAVRRRSERSVHS